MAEASDEPAKPKPNACAQVCAAITVPFALCCGICCAAALSETDEEKLRRRALRDGNTVIVRGGGGPRYSGKGKTIIIAASDPNPTQLPLLSCNTMARDEGPLSV